MLAQTCCRAILRDPELYEDPDTFNPDRFLTTDTEGNVVLDKSVPDPSDAAFGFGRRACPGRYMAYEALWIAFASVLAAFDLRKAKGENGEEVTPECVFDDGFTRSVSMICRSQTIADNKVVKLPEAVQMFYQPTNTGTQSVGSERVDRTRVV